MSRRILLFLYFMGVAFGQVTTATFYGIVTDSSGAVVAGANVTLTADQTGATYRKLSSSTGEFQFDFLPVGAYTLQIEAKGFKVLKTKGFTLTAGQQTRQTYALELGEMTQTVTVESESPMLNTVSAEQQQSRDPLTLTETPLARRDISNILTLGTGVSSGAGVLRLNGVGEAGTNFSVDGTGASGNTEGRNYSTFGSSGYISIMSLDAVAEVQTVKGVAPAEYGDALGGQVNLLTRSGTNQFHGSLFENFQSQVLNARNQLLASKAPLVLNQYGASAGGALRRDRIFIFGDYEGYQERSTNVVQGTVPTQSVRDQLLAAVPSYALALNAIPLPNQPTAAGATTGTFLLGKAARKSDNHLDLKGDIVLGAASRLSLSFNQGRPFQLTPTTAVGNANARQFVNVVERGTASFTTGGATWTSETRFGYSITDTSRTDQFFNQFNPDKTTELFAFGERVPQISTSLGWSTPSAESYQLTGPTMSFSSKLSKQLGQHSLKFGADYSRICCSRTDPQNPTFQYSTLAQLLSNTPTTVTPTFGNGLFNAALWHAGLFVQDGYRIRQNLVVTVGLRNDFYSNLQIHPLGKLGEGTGFYNPDGMLDSQFHVGPFRPQSSPYKPDWLNLAPRLGFSYTPRNNGKTVLRGGFGMFFSSQLPGAMWQSVQPASNVPFRSVFSQQDILKYGLQWPLYNDDLRGFAQQQQAANGVTNVFSVFNPDLQNAYTMQYSLGIQRELTSSLVLETGFVGTRGVKFLAQRPMNNPDRATGLRPNPKLSVTYYVDNSQQMVYNSWQSTLTKRFSRNLSGSVNYTWGKSLATQGGDNGAYYQGDAATKTQDFFNFKADRGPSAGDVTHYFVAQWVYRIPQMNVGRYVGPVLNGWQVSGVSTAQTGQAVTVTQSSSIAASRPDYIGGDALLPDYVTTHRYINTAAYARVPIIAASGATARPGNAGNGELRGPGSWNVDFSIGKNFRITERLRLQFRTDMFNSLNHTNLSGLVAEITNPRFGQLTSTGGARTVQLNARMSW